MNDIPNDWQSLVETALECVTGMDVQRWQLGDIAAVAETRHGFDSIKALATEIRMPRHKTLYEYHRVSKFYDESTRVDYPLLSWSHFREATRLETLEAARALLDKAHDLDWPVAKLAHEIKALLGETVPPEKLFDVTAAITHIAGQLVTLRLPQGVSGALVEAYRGEKGVRVAAWISDQPAPTPTTKENLGGGGRERRFR